MAQAEGIEWQTVREAARQEQSSRDMLMAATMTDDEFVDYALENHSLEPADVAALEAAARSDA